MLVPKLHYSVSGSTGKPAIVFLHGFPFNQTMWDEQARLCESTFRVVSYDQRGHGQSEAGDGQYFFEFFIDDLVQLLNTLKIEKAILCGLSMGGYIALRMAERHPERVQGLLLCDTRSEADSNAAKINRTVDFRLIQTEGLAAFADKFLKKALAPATFLKRPSLVKEIREMILSNPLEGVQGTLIALATRTDTTSSLAAIKVPTLILVGADDPITPPSAAEALHRQIAGSRLSVIPEAAHLSNLENPKVFNSLMTNFLSTFSIP